MLPFVWITDVSIVFANSAEMIDRCIVNHKTGLEKKQFLFSLFKSHFFYQLFFSKGKLKTSQPASSSFRTVGNNVETRITGSKDYIKLSRFPPFARAKSEIYLLSFSIFSETPTCRRHDFVNPGKKISVVCTSSSYLGLITQMACFKKTKQYDALSLICAIL